MIRIGAAAFVTTLAVMAFLTAVTASVDEEVCYVTADGRTLCTTRN